MKIKYVECSVRPVNLFAFIKSLFPAKWKRYVLKWASLKKNMVNHILVSSCNLFKPLCIEIALNNGRTIYSSVDKVLNDISDFENMRNADELCIWLDMKDI